jgi:hypothetical protein
VNILVLGFRPIVRGKVRIVVDGASSSDGIQISRPVEMSAEEKVVELEWFGFGVYEIITDGLYLDICGPLSQRLIII